MCICLHIGWGTNGMLWWWAGGSTGGASALSPPAPDVWQSLSLYWYTVVHSNCIFILTRSNNNYWMKDQNELQHGNTEVNLKDIDQCHCHCQCHFISHAIVSVTLLVSFFCLLSGLALKRKPAPCSTSWWIWKGQGEAELFLQMDFMKSYHLFWQIKTQWMLADWMMTRQR